MEGEYDDSLESKKEASDDIDFTSKGLKECKVKTHHRIGAFGELDQEKEL